MKRIWPFVSEEPVRGAAPAAHSVRALQGEHVPVAQEVLGAAPGAPAGRGADPERDLFFRKTSLESSAGSWRPAFGRVSPELIK